MFPLIVITLRPRLSEDVIALKDQTVQHVIVPYYFLAVFVNAHHRITPAIGVEVEAVDRFGIDIGNILYGYPNVKVVIESPVKPQARFDIFSNRFIYNEYNI